MPGSDGPISGTVDILTELNSHRVSLYALSNWSVEALPAALERFEFLKWFRGVMLSGEVKLLKPDPRIFKLFLETFAIDPALTVYIDDREPNVRQRWQVVCAASYLRTPPRFGPN
jgi:2-haloacid dehalogenase